ncbi:MAG TPA: hypothetical protein VI757_12725 [Bacteroidia bacterium]|nr:hypothetical protein [Bacteroidia bacterium]
MNRFEAFHTGFLFHVENIKSTGNFSDDYCRDEWKFDAGRMLLRGSKPNLKTYFKFCVAIGKCPVEFMILLLKDFLDPETLILFIRKEYEFKKSC